MENQEWKTRSGQLEMEHYKWKTGSGKLEV